MQAVAMTRGVSKAGGATDQCRDNLRAAWPLLREAGRSAAGLRLLGGAAKACAPLGGEGALPTWAQSPYFYLAEGNYPFPSTYITFSVSTGRPSPLPAWPMRMPQRPRTPDEQTRSQAGLLLTCLRAPPWTGVACAQGLNDDLGIRLSGSVEDVRYNLSLGDLRVEVDWGSATGNGDALTAAQINASGVLRLAAAVADAAGVWYNLTKDQPCYKIGGSSDGDGDGDGDGAAAAPQAGVEALSVSAAAARQLVEVEPVEVEPVEVEPVEVELMEAAGEAGEAAAVSPKQRSSCPACPPCDDCPPCPVSYCDYEDEAPCSFSGELSRGFSWGGICCNDALSQVDIRGVGRDIFWPPQVPNRSYSVESIVGPRHLTPGGCAAHGGLRGGPLVSDRWSSWMQASAVSKLVNSLTLSK